MPNSISEVTYLSLANSNLKSIPKELRNPLLVFPFTAHFIEIIIILYISILVVTLENLDEIDFSYNPLPPESGAIIATMMRNNKKLRYLQ